MIQSASAVADGNAGGPPIADVKKTREWFVTNGLLAIIGLAFLAPMLWLALAAVDANAGWALQLPHFTLANLIAVTRGDYLQALLNTLEISLVATGVSTIAGVFGGYALSRRNIPLSDELMVGVLFLTGIPVAIMIVPVFEVFAKYDLLSLVPTGVFLGVTSLPFALWLIKTAIDAVPKELEEAATIERANILQVILHVTVPVALPGIFAAAIYSFINAWGAFLPPLVLISDPSQATGPLKIYGLIGSAAVRYGDIAAFSIVYSLPVVVLYILMSRPFSGGFSMGGAVKG
ncbi:MULTISPECIES: carbohydrate ABC transporter permease [unclassified Acidisoma]|jgi:multiple sugar transport system permease protein|uniref:carbohydrate ABC transporter permease n=1 Tax=unclassified Acidisoma TaxID=2634065 RepID=UPI00131B7F75|nr:MULTISPECIES: carbohydrate ABC transporter permease [unclassified Acidisoma]